MTDKEFEAAIDKLLKGDKEGLECIYRAYIKMIYTVVYNTVGNREEAEDITSEFFIKLVRVAGSFKKGSKHKTWLATIAKNMAIDSIRKRNREVLVSPLESNDDEEKQISISEVAVINDENIASPEGEAVLNYDMKMAMKELSDKEREIIDLKLIGDMKFKEISEVLGQPIGTVTWLYNQGIKKLRRCLANYE